MTRAAMLDLINRNDGFMLDATDNPVLDALRDDGLMTIQYVGDGYVIARAPKFPPIERYRRPARHVPRLADLRISP